MGLNTIATRIAGIISPSFFNDLKTAICGTLVGRDATTGAPAPNQDLGSPAYEWNRVYCKEIFIQGTPLAESNLGIGRDYLSSGKTRTTSTQSAFLTPAGAGGGASFSIAANVTNLVYDIGGTQYVCASLLTKSSLTTAPSSNNTCLINDADLSGQYDSRLVGEEDQSPWVAPIKTSMVVDNMGSSVSALVGKRRAFKIGTELFIATIASTTSLTNIRRGFFYDKDLNPINRVAISNNDTVTLLSLGFVFLDADTSTVDVCYEEPTYDYDAPSGPSTNDYWFDMANGTWKKYNGSSWSAVSRAFLGWVAIDSADCIGARCVRYRKGWDKQNDIGVSRANGAIDLLQSQVHVVNVNGAKIRIPQKSTGWDMSTDLASSVDMYDATEQSTRPYWFYMDEYGKKIISDITPYFEQDMQGFYHPHNTWRALVLAYNSGGNLTTNRVFVTPGQSNGDYQYFRTATYVPTNDPTTVSSNVIDWGNASIQGFGRDHITDDIANDRWKYNFWGFYKVTIKGSITWDSTGNKAPVINLRVGGSLFAIEDQTFYIYYGVANQTVMFSLEQTICLKPSSHNILDNADATFSEASSGAGTFHANYLKIEYLGRNLSQLT